MKKTINKFINIESFNTINNYTTKTHFITVNRLIQKNLDNKTIINQRRNNIISEDNFGLRPFIYKKKPRLIKSNSFYIKNKKNLSLRNDKSISLIKEREKNNNLMLIPSYKHFDLNKNYCEFRKLYPLSKKVLSSFFLILSIRAEILGPCSFTILSQSNLSAKLVRTTVIKISAKEK